MNILVQSQYSNEGVTGKRDGAEGRGREYYLARHWMLPSFNIFLIIVWKHIYLKILQNRLHNSAGVATPVGCQPPAGYVGCQPFLHLYYHHLWLIPSSLLLQQMMLFKLGNGLP